MLIYLGVGQRHYGREPFKIAARRAWEFQAVVQGRISMELPSGPEELRQRRLWLSPPGHLHGWTGDRTRAAEVVVFHFPSIPEPLRRLVQDGRAVEMALSGAMCRRLRELAGKALAYRQRPSPGMMLCYEHVLLELSLMLYEAKRDHAAEGLGGSLDNDRRVGEALRWFSDRIESNPSQAEVARAVNVSPAHLRRLFHEVLQAAPKQMFDQLRFLRAIQLMTDSTVKLSLVSAACGFESQSAFSRAFKAKFGCAPAEWRG